MRKGRGSEETGHLLPLGQNVSSYRGAYMVPVFKLSVGMCVTLNNLFLLIATAVRGRFPQTRHLWKRTSVGESVGRFFARRLEVVAFAGLLRLSWCVPGGVLFFVFFFRLFFSSNAHGLLHV